jgi:LacI family transcriptional regulator
LIIDASQPYDRKIVQGVAAYVRDVDDWSIYIEEGYSQRMPDLRRWAGDGIIANLDDLAVVKALRRLNIPIVGIGGGYNPAMRIPYFVSNETAIARMAAEHLIERGFTQLAFCGFPRTRTNLWSQARAEAFRSHVAGAGLLCHVFTGRHRTARDWDGLQKEMGNWLSRLPKPLGLMACDDVRARHVLEACHRLGFRVPDDVAVIGVDNNDMLCELSMPPLSSVEQGLRRMGYQAAALLDRLMAGKRITKMQYTVDPDAVITRGSTDSYAVDDATMAVAARFVRDHACDRLCVSDVARAAQMSRSSLERKFQNVFGRSVHAEIQRVRIERVRQLAITTDLPLKRIALQSGFRHVTYMTTLFRQCFDCTPAKYRQRFRLSRVSCDQSGRSPAISSQSSVVR